MSHLNLVWPGAPETPGWPGFGRLVRFLLAAAFLRRHPSG